MPTLSRAPAVARPRACVLLAFLVNGIGIGAWAAGVPLVQHRFALSAPALGVLLLGLGVGAIAAMILAGRVVDRAGSARVMLVSCWVFAAVLALPLVAPGVPALAVCIVLIGGGAGLLDVAMNAQGSEVERLGGRPMMSSFHAAFSVGGLAGAALGSVLGLAPSAAIMAAAALAATMLGGIATVPGSAPVPRLALPDRTLLGICVLAGASMLSEGAVSDWGGIYLRDDGHAPARLVGLGFAAFSLAMTAGRLGGDAALRRLGPARAIRMGGLLAAAGLLLAIGWPGLAGITTGLFMVGLGLANVVPAAYSAGANSPGRPPGMGIAMVATVAYGGFLMGPPVIGFVAGLVGLRAALAVVAAGCLVVAMQASKLGQGSALDPPGPGGPEPRS